MYSEAKAIRGEKARLSLAVNVIESSNGFVGYVKTVSLFDCIQKMLTDQ